GNPAQRCNDFCGRSQGRGGLGLPNSVDRRMVSAMSGKFTLRLLMAVAAFLAGFETAWAQRFPIVHRHVGGENDVLANAYLIETKKGVVAVDATMTVTESARLRADLLALHKPLLAVLVTHGHPDHYGGVTGLVANDKVPVIA